MPRASHEQAFPSAGDEETVKSYGMTMREWYAGQALANLACYTDLDTKPWKEGQPTTAQRIAAQCFAYADAMLAEALKQ